MFAATGTRFAWRNGMDNAMRGDSDSDSEGEWREATRRHRDATDSKTRGQALGVMAVAVKQDWRFGSQSREFIDALVVEVSAIVRGESLGASPRDREELIQDVLRRLLAVCKADGAPRICSAPDDPNLFIAWLRRVVKNRWHDGHRHESSQKRRIKELAESGVATILEHEHEAAEVRDFMTSPFSDHDLACVRRWGERDRIMLLTLSGSWLKLPESLREKFLAEYEREWSMTVVRPFPPRECLEATNPDDRLATAAKALGMSKRALECDWDRKRETLLELDWLKLYESLARRILGSRRSSPSLQQTMRATGGKGAEA